MKIGVISDTHGLVREEAMRKLRGVALIIHAGDIGSPRVLAALEAICPVEAVCGNVDKGAWAHSLPERVLVEVQGRRIYVIHNLKKLDVDPVVNKFDIVISGHSHKPKCEEVNSVLYLNPGSAGPRRFKLPIAVATLEILPSGISADLHLL